MHKLMISSSCVKCGLCVEVCPMALIDLGDGPTAQPIEKAPDLCIGCGHCVAACPTAAITLDTTPGQDLDTLPDHLPHLDQFRDLVRTRRSTRLFLNESVSRTELEALLDVTRWAPTAKNSEQVFWTVVQESERVHTLAGLAIDFFRNIESMQGVVKVWDKGIDIINRDAPHLVLAHSPVDAMTPTLDCTIAMNTLELAAHAAGLGTCWAGFFLMAAQNHAPLQKALDLPAEHKIQAALMLGKPRYPYQRIPARSPNRTNWI